MIISFECNNYDDDDEDDDDDDDDAETEEHDTVRVYRSHRSSLTFAGCNKAVSG